MSRGAMEDLEQHAYTILKEPSDKQPLWGSIRTRMAALACLGLANVYAMRVNLSSAVEPMQCTYEWSDGEEGIILSSFFWGYILFQIPGGMLATHYGGKVVFGLGVLSTSIFTILLPFCAHSLPLLYAIRGLTGVGEAVTFPALTVMATNWFPAPERSTLFTFTNAGSFFGTALAFPIAGELMNMSKKPQDAWSKHQKLCPNGISTTWPFVFYFFGAVGIIWWMLWQRFVTATPEEHKTISKEELEYITRTSKEVF